MAGKHAFWVIVAGNTPTAFRARLADELLPTLHQLQRTHPDVVLRWFDRGKLWDSPEQALEALKAARRAKSDRGKDWRPGGEHADPRARFKLTRDEKRARFKRRQWRDDRPPSTSDSGRSGADRPPTSYPRRDDRRPWSGRRDDRPPLSERRDDRRPPSERRDDRRPSSGDRYKRRPPGGPPDDRRPPTGRWEDRRSPSGRRDERRPPSGARDDRRPPSGRWGDRPTSSGRGDDRQAPKGPRDDRRGPGAESQRPWKPKSQWRPENRQRTGDRRPARPKGPRGPRGPKR